MAKVCFLRSPRTQNERKANSDPQYSGFVRAGRRNLPSSWDDIARGDTTERSWKRHRTTQWRD